MKKSLYLILLMTIFVVGSVEVNASSGALRKASIKTCNGITYGQHSSDNHWHVAEESDGKYYATGDPIYSDPCSSSSNSSNNDNSGNSGGSSNDSSNSNSGGESSSGNSSSSNNSGSSGSTNNNTSSNNNSDSGSSSNNSSSSSSNNTSTTKPNSSSSSSTSSSTEKEEIKSNDNTLKNIIIDGKEIDVEDNIDYSTTKEKIIINVTTNDEKAKYEIKNNSTLEIGENKISIEVTAEDGTTKTYNINVKRDKILSSDTGIKVIINEEEVNFSDNKATVYVSATETNLKIDYTLNDENAKVEMDKIEELKTGDNELKIKVIAEDGTEKEYEIIIHKYTKSEETISTILGLAIIGGMGYGIYYVIKKVVPKVKNIISKIKK